MEPQLTANYYNNGNIVYTTELQELFKILLTKSQSNTIDCQNYFNFPDINASLRQRKCKFLSKFAASENSICHTLRSIAQRELDYIV